MMSKTLLPLPALLLAAACGGEVDPGNELVSQDSAITSPLSLLTCNNVFTFMSTLPPTEPLPLARFVVIGKFGGGGAEVGLDVAPNQLADTSAAYGDHNGRNADPLFLMRKRFQLVAGRNMQVSSTMRVALFDEATGNTRFDATVVPTECTVDGDVATVRGELNGTEITVKLYGRGIGG